MRARILAELPPQTLKINQLYAQLKKIVQQTKFSNFCDILLSVSEDGGRSWRALAPLGPKFRNVIPFQGIVALKGRPGRYLGVFHRGDTGYRYYGHFIAWIGPYAELKEGIVRSGCHIKLLHNYGAPADCGYAGVHRLPDGTLLATTYNACAPGEKCSIVSVRFGRR